MRVRLFVRDKRSTQLTAAGRQLLEDGRPLLAAAEALQRRVAQADRGTASFSAGFMPGITVTEWVRAFTARHPDVEVQLVRTTWDDQVQTLRDGRVDVGVVRLPIDQRGLTAAAASAVPSKPRWITPSAAAAASRSTSNEAIVPCTGLAPRPVTTSAD